MKKIFEPIKFFVLKYPAVLAAYFIYAYYFLSTMDFYITFKKKHLSATETLQHFDTLFWMWILAYALIKVIDLREKLHSKEKEVTEHEYSLQIKETQINTLHEVIATLKHEINNPLAIVFGYLRLLRRQVTDEDALKKVTEIEIASKRIDAALKDFSEAKVYQVTPSPVGNLVDIESIRSASSPDSSVS